MNLINKNNYEAFLLDYVEGNLTPELTAELMLFFENHPELKEDVEDFDIVTLTPENITLKEKESLKVNEDEISLINYEDYIIAEIENQNSSEQSLALSQFINQNPDKQKEFKAYQKTKLVAPNIIFENKADLKQEENKIIPLYWWYSAAAAVILALFFLKVDWNKDEEIIPFAEKNKTEIPINMEGNNDLKNENEVVNNIHQLANEEKNTLTTSPKTDDKKYKTNSINKVNTETKKPVLVEDEEPSNLIANDNIQEHSHDSIVPQINESIDEDILYADNVKIIYEDESSSQNSSSNNNEFQKKVSKFKMLREMFAFKVKDKIIDNETDANGEVVAQALNIGPFNFSRNKK